MAKIYARESQKTRIDPFSPLFRGADTVHLDLATGSIISIRVTDGRRTRAMRVAGGWSVQRGLTTHDATFHRFLWKLVASSAAEETEALVLRINAETYGERVQGVKLKYMRSRWGSCSTNGDIALSTPLLLTTPEILRYVIIHELAHIKHPDHSKDFWNRVELFVPGHQKLRNALRQFTVHTDIPQNN
jgi:predicted metal-dependent hydrolase